MNLLGPVLPFLLNHRANQFLKLCLFSIQEARSQWHNDNTNKLFCLKMYVTDIKIQYAYISHGANRAKTYINAKWHLFWIR